MSAKGMNPPLRSGEYYWVRQTVENQWRPCYIGEDPDEKLWLHNFCSQPMEIAKMDLSKFDMIYLPRPAKAGPAKKIKK